MHCPRFNHYHTHRRLHRMSTNNPFAKTQTARNYITSYKWYTEVEGEEPTTITLHECAMRYGGPEEGGWYYQQGWPVKTICVFSKKQAIREAIKLQEWAEEEYGERKDYLGWDTWSVSFSNGYAKAFPEERPYYC